MTLIQFSFDTERPMDPTAWPDYVATAALLAFYGILCFCIVITAKASTQARVSLALKDPFWINIMYMGSFLAATSLFISNKHLDILDPIRNLHCSLWDCWGLMGGFTLWILYWISSLVTSRIRQSGFALTSVSLEQYEESDITPTFTYDHELQELKKGRYMEEHDPHLVQRSPETMTTIALTDDAACTEREEAGAEEEEQVVPEYYNFSRDNSDSTAGQRRRFSCLCAPCRAVSEGFSHWWWTRTDINARLGIFRSLCCLVLMTIFVVVCAIAEIPGVTTFHAKLNACIANFYYKLLVVAILCGYLIVSWILYWMMTRRSNFLPTNASAFLFAANYRNALMAMTVALSLMIFLNMASLLSLSVIRSADFLIFIALLLYGISQMIGRTAWECLRGTYESDREIEESLTRLGMPTNFTDIVSDPAYVPVLQEFYRYVRSEERGRMYLVDRKKLEYRGHGPPVILPGYVCRWDPTANRYANADQNYPLFLDRIADLHEAIWLRKRNLSDTAGQLATSTNIDRRADEIFAEYFKTTARSYEVLCHDHPQRAEIFKGTIPAIPISPEAVERLKTNLTFHPMDLAAFQDIAEYLDTILQSICWTKFFNDGRTMRHLREASIVQTELIQSLAKSTTGAHRGLCSDGFGEDVIVDRHVMADMPNYYDRPNDGRPADLDMASFAIGEDDDDED